MYSNVQNARLHIRELAIELLRDRDGCAYADFEIANFKQAESARQHFETASAIALSKQEIVSEYIGGIQVLKPSQVPSSSQPANVRGYVVTTLLLGLKGTLPYSSLNMNADYLYNILAGIASLPPGKVLIYEFVWRPASLAGRGASEDELISDYPNLRMI